MAVVLKGIGKTAAAILESETEARLKDSQNKHEKTGREPELSGSTAPPQQGSPQEEITRLGQELRDSREQHKAALETIASLEQEKAEILGVLETINRSAAFELLKKFRSFKSRILPPGTRRRRWCDRLMRTLIRRHNSAASPQISEIGKAEESLAEVPADFYRAELKLHAIPKLLRAGARAAIEVTVTNAGEQVWPARGKLSGMRGSVRLSYHWYDGNEKTERGGGEHTNLGSDLAAGESVNVNFNIFVPFKAGNYTLEITLVHEGIAWFEQKGMRPIRVPVEVERETQLSEEWPSCSIVIPVFNRAAFTYACLLGIERSVSPEVPYEVIVVDNGSSDETPEILRAWSKKQANGRVVWMGENSGFARACNEGARLARGEYIVLLNNDTLPTPGWLERLLECAKEEPNAGIIGSKLLFSDGRLQHVGVVFDEFRNPRHIYRGLSANITPAKLNRECQAVTGACMLIPRTLYWALGGMDERYRNSCEDVDLCMKVRELGYRVLFCANSVVYHFESLSQGRHDNDLRNLGLFKARWGSKIHSDADEWCQRDGIRDELTQFEPHRGYDSKQEKKIEEVWTKVFSSPFPKTEYTSYAMVPKSSVVAGAQVRTRGRS